MGWLRLKIADLNRQCFKKNRTNLVSTGQGLNSTESKMHFHVRENSTKHLAK